MIKRFTGARAGVSYEGVIWGDGSASVRINGAAPTFWTAAQVDARRHPADGSASDMQVVDTDPDADGVPARPCDAPSPCPHDLAFHRYRPDGSRQCLLGDCDVANPPSNPRRPKTTGGSTTSSSVKGAR